MQPGILVCTQATFPTLARIGATFVYVSDFAHMIYWNGAAAAFSDGGNGFIGLFESNPGIGWALYDGSTVNRLNADGTLTPVTLPDLTGGTFLESGATNSGPTAAVAPTFTGTPLTPAGSVSTPAFTGNPLTPSGVLSSPIFTGTAATLASGTFTPVALATTAIESINGSASSYTPAGTVSTSIFTGIPVTPTGTVSTPSFTGTPFTPSGTISSSGEPRKIVRRPYYRL